MAKAKRKALGVKVGKGARKALKKARRASPVVLGVAGVAGLGGLASALLLSTAIRGRVKGVAENLILRAESVIDKRKKDAERDEGVRSQRNGIAGGAAAS